MLVDGIVYSVGVRLVTAIAWMLAAGADVAGVSVGAAQPVAPPASSQPSGDRTFDPAFYRPIPFSQVMDPPIGAPISHSPVMGLREDLVRAKAIYLGHMRESVKTDTRLRDAWIRSRGSKPGVAKAFAHEFEFADGDHRFWLPVLSLSAVSLFEARAGDEVELYVHRFDAPMAGRELPGPEAVVMAVFLARRAGQPAPPEGTPK